MKFTVEPDWDVADAEDMLFDLAKDLGAKRTAMETINTLKKAVKNLAEEQHKLVDAYRDKVEQLEAEVESWKNSYERAVKEGAELIRKSLEENERLRLTLEREQG